MNLPTLIKPAASDPKEWEFPEFDTMSFDSKQTNYCICIFVINEGARIQAQLEKMARLNCSADIIIADGGSTDGSLSPEFLRSQGVNTLLSKKGSGKLSAQMRMAFAYALNRGYQGIITIDGNDKDDPAAIAEFIEALDKGFDYIQGSRFIPGGSSVNLPLSRWLGIRLIHAPLISLVARYKYTDTTNGFRAFSRRFLMAAEVLPFRNLFSQYELHYYLAIQAARLGYRVKEVPVTRRYPAHGKLPTKISPFRGNLLILKTLFSACLGLYNPAKRVPPGRE